MATETSAACHSSERTVGSASASLRPTGSARADVSERRTAKRKGAMCILADEEWGGRVGREGQRVVKRRAFGCPSPRALKAPQACCTERKRRLPRARPPFRRP